MHFCLGRPFLCYSEAEVQQGDPFLLEAFLLIFRISHGNHPLCIAVSGVSWADVKILRHQWCAFEI